MPSTISSRKSTRVPVRVSHALSVVILVASVSLITACSANSAPTASSSSVQPVSRQVNDSRVVSNSPAFASTATLISPDVRAQADAMEQVLINVYQRVDPAVVNIEVNLDGSPDIDASGSGFVIDTDGHIVTNNHVIDQARDITVTFYDGYTLDAELIGQDNFSDLAVIKVNAPIDRLLPITFGDSSKLQVGQRVIAIGNPFGLLSSMTTGIISATGRTLNSSRLSYRNPSIIQTDAQINPGNSGGPLLDMNGRVIGVNTAISTDTGTFQGVGFAVPSNTVQRVIPQLIKNGKAEYSWLGIRSVGGREGLSVAALAEILKLPVDSGVMISDIVAGSPAEVAGLRGGTQSQTIRGQDVLTGGDIIVALNDTPIRDMDALLAYLVANTAPGDIISVTFVRGNETQKVDVKLEARPAEEQ